MMLLYNKVSQHCSRITTEAYSSSFSSAIRLLHKDLRNPVYNIYGFVRFADEIVDTFQDYNKQELLQQFRSATFNAILQEISLNPILQSFQLTVNQYAVDPGLIESFFRSMEMDLTGRYYDAGSINEYIYGSAEAVGLMCLHIFCEGNDQLYRQLKPYAQSLGAAFQKVNFLRDLKADYNNLNRVYFPGMDLQNFTPHMKQQIEEDIAGNFHHAFQGILQLPGKARFGVYVAYKYYLSLFNKIRKVKSSGILEKRVSIPGYRKAMIVMRAGLKNQLHLI